MKAPIAYERAGPVAVIRLQSPPVNALSCRVRIALHDAIMRAAEDQAVNSIVLAGNAKCFSAGADIGEFQSDDANAMFASRDPVEVIATLERLGKPVVAAIEGVALGGGLELALGCHARVAAPGAKLGLPEIRLGLIPGAGGTQRLPRLIGLDAAMRMMLSGNAVTAEHAHAQGLIDRVVSSDVVDAAIHYAGALAASGAIRRTRDRMIPDSDGMQVHLEAWQLLAKKAKAPPIAADQLIACAQDAVNLPFDDAVKAERRRFLTCNESDAAAGLQHAFFATRRAAQVPAECATTKSRLIERIAIVGGGTMGRGIAIAFASSGFNVTVIEADAERAAATARTLCDEFQGLVASGRLDTEHAAQCSARICVNPEFDAVQSADLVIEAVFESMDVKREVCRRLGRTCKPGAVIASNTSTLDINVLARETGRPDEFLGLHFFSPAHVMRLVEVIRGDQTAVDVLATAMELVRKLGKNPVISGVCYGFIGNRMLEPYLRETEALLMQGCTPRQIDTAIEEFGMAMGPCRMMDLAGVDVVAKVVSERDKQGCLPNDPLYRIVCRELAGKGRLGQKTGKGFYAYEGRRAIEDAGAIETIRVLASRHHVPQRARIAPQEIADRCLLPLINEGFLIVEEGIANRESDVDVVWLSGYGFPAERGGPMFYARRFGLGKIGDKLRHYADASGDPYDYWRIARTIREAIQTEANFSDGLAHEEPSH